MKVDMINEILETVHSIVTIIYVIFTIVYIRQKIGSKKSAKKDTGSSSPSNSTSDLERLLALFAKTSSSICLQALKMVPFPELGQAIETRNYQYVCRIITDFEDLHNDLWKNIQHLLPPVYFPGYDKVDDIKSDHSHLKVYINILQKEVYDAKNNSAVDESFYEISQDCRNSLISLNKLLIKLDEDIIAYWDNVLYSM